MEIRRESYLTWCVYREFQTMVDRGIAGPVTSLRFYWQAPRSQRMDRGAFVIGLLGGMLEATEALGGGELTTLHVEEACEGDVIFALAQLKNRVVAEFELNQALPEGGELLSWLLVDCERGRITNKPLIGHQSVEGSLLVIGGKRELISFYPVSGGDANTVDPRIREILKGKFKELV